MLKPQTAEFTLITKAKDLVKHTDTMTSERRYPKKYRFTLVNRMQERAMSIFESIVDANDLNLADPEESRQRLELQRKAMTQCKTMLFLIEVSLEKNLINAGQCIAWTRAVMEVKNMAATWYKKDRERAKQHRNQP